MNRITLADREHFSRIVVICQTRKFNLKELFQYELANIPLSIATSDGTLWKTQKVSLLQEIQELVSVKTTYALQIADKSKTCGFFNLMALIQSTGKFARTCNTFGEYESKLFEISLPKSLSVV